MRLLLGCSLLPLLSPLRASLLHGCSIPLSPCFLPFLYLFSLYGLGSLGVRGLSLLVCSLPLCRLELFRSAGKEDTGEGMREHAMFYDVRGKEDVKCWRRGVGDMADGCFVSWECDE
jgi:hypothetical protein